MKTRGKQYKRRKEKKKDGVAQTKGLTNDISKKQQKTNKTKAKDT